MCWSATADLTTGTAVSAVGLLCLARTRRVRDLPLAALPLLAVWVPWGALLAAAPAARRRLLGPAAVGLATAAVLAYCLTARPVTAEIRGHVIGYGVSVPYVPLVLAGYLFATLGSLLLAGDRTLRVLGTVLGAGAVVCAVVWRLEFASTWCAFAAIASLLVLGWVRRDGGGRAHWFLAPSTKSR
ncbi:DUF6629 family protein [Streptomyces sp. G-G2]|uniref:DUF6629 family protein n=1 Tax=Streptomyces sp. G-G2 TaxID=3046201 RepID=UPI0024B990BF|nr:DUF6629 family protein [Streptomyces sp. G-G2]MDJ0379959.1 hypothetical protein [Streptomyces sp. G-G2]